MGGGEAVEVGTWRGPWEGGGATGEGGLRRMQRGGQARAIEKGKRKKKEAGDRERRGEKGRRSVSAS